MTKEEFIEYAQKIVSKSDVTDEVKEVLHPAIIEQALDLSFRDVIDQLYRREKTSKGGFTGFDSYTKPFYDVEVKKDSTRNESYLDVPMTEMIIQLPGNRGVVSIHPMNDRLDKLVLRPMSGTSVFDRLGNNVVSSRKMAYLENNKVYFISPVGDCKKYMFKLLVPFSSFEDSDEIVFPYDSNSLIIQNLIKVIKSPGFIDNQNNQSLDNGKQ